MNADSGVPLKSRKVDGGMVVNELLMQSQADILGVLVIRPVVAEPTVLGAAYATGLAVGFWTSEEDIRSNWAKNKQWDPKMPEELRIKQYHEWQKAVTKPSAGSSERSRAIVIAHHSFAGQVSVEYAPRCPAWLGVKVSSCQGDGIRPESSSDDPF